MKLLMTLLVCAVTITTTTLFPIRPIIVDGQHPRMSFDTIATTPGEAIIIRESEGVFYEYPSTEDAAIIQNIEQDSVVHYLLFQETNEGDVYTIK